MFYRERRQKFQKARESINDAEISSLVTALGINAAGYFRAVNSGASGSDTLTEEQEDVLRQLNVYSRRLFESLTEGLNEMASKAKARPSQTPLGEFPALNVASESSMPWNAAVGDRPDSDPHTWLRRIDGLHALSKVISTRAHRAADLYLGTQFTLPMAGTSKKQLHQQVADAASQVAFLPGDFIRNLTSPRPRNPKKRT